jgi:type I restriction enzyme S subunit
MSDVPEGYKMSKVGVIPEDWEVKSLENIGLFKKGKNIPKKDLTSEGVPCVLYGEIYTEYNFTSNKLNSFIPHAIAQQSTSINKGDILFAGSGETAEEIGKCFTYLGDEKACAGGDINIFCPLNDDSTFLGYLLNSVQVNKQKSNLGQGSSVVHIYSSSLKIILIPLPPPLEQQAIASALSDVDALITALGQLITKKRNIKQGAMQLLLTGKKRLPGFSGEWEVKKLGEIADIISGGTPSTNISEFWNGDIKWCTPTDITRTKQKYLLQTEKNISEKGLRNSSATLLPVGALLLCSRATIGEIRIAKDVVCTNQGFKSLVCKKSFDNQFVYYLLLQSKQKLINKAIGSTFLEISKKDTDAIEFIFPSFPEQQVIAQILSDIDTEIESLVQKRNKYKAIKQGMMQELLTGKTRFL